jgi:glycosyltransferase involved in cell wall biosynthesis
VKAKGENSRKGRQGKMGRRVSVQSTYRVLLVAPSPPPYGGMALQARLLEKQLRGEGNSVFFLSSNFPLPRGLGLFAYIPWVRTFVRMIVFFAKLCKRARQAEVIHIFAASWVYFFVVTYPTVMVGRLFRKRVIVNYRGGEARSFFRRFSWAARPVFTFASVVTAPSGFVAEVIREFFHIPVLIVPNILDVSVFRYRPRIGVQPKLLVTRHLEKMYDIETILKAFRVVQDHYSEATLWIAGTGSQEESLRSTAAHLHLRNVRFLGHVPREALAGIFDQCDILINASRVDNFPAALIEGSAAGLVVVSTCAGGIPFMYQDGKDALLVESGDWEGLAQAVEKVLVNPSLASELIRSASAVVQRSDWNEVRKLLYKGYGFLDEQGQDEEIRASEIVR